MTASAATSLVPEPLTRAGLEDFRVSQPLEIQTLLNQMADQDTVIGLSAPGGAFYTTTMWEVDRAKGVIRMDADLVDPGLDRILAADEVMAVGYLEQVKIQFEVRSLMMIKGIHRVLNCAFPLEAYRFQRRANFRVQPLHNPPPVVRVRPQGSSHTMELRILDVSVSGVALLMPENAAAIIGAGSRLKAVDVELDNDTYFVADLSVMHALPLRSEQAGVRLGCEIQGLSGPAERALQRFIDQTQKRRRAADWADA